MLLISEFIMAIWFFTITVTLRAKRMVWNARDGRRADQ